MAYGRWDGEPRTPQDAGRIHPRRSRGRAPPLARRLGHRLAPLEFPGRARDPRFHRRARIPPRRAGRPRPHERHPDRGRELPAAALRVPDPQARREREHRAALRARVGPRPPPDVRVHDPQVHARHPPPRRARAALHAPDERPGDLPPRRGEGLPRHRQHARRGLPHHGVRRRPEEQGLALHEAHVEARGRVRADLRQAPLPHRRARAERHLPDHPVPAEEALPVQLRHPGPEHQFDLPVQALLPEKPAFVGVFAGDAGGRRRRVHAERQRLLGRQLPRHPLRRGHAGAAAAQAPRARAVERVGARSRRLRRLRIPGHRPRDGGGQRARRGVARQVQGAAEKGGHPPPPTYKERQKKAVIRRLQLGLRDEKTAAKPKKEEPALQATKRHGRRGGPSSRS